MSDQSRASTRLAFEHLTGHQPDAWQQRLLDQFLGGDLPTALDLPTGIGKTSVIPIWLIARALGARVPRRLVYVVDRRAVVDQASGIAETLAEQLRPAAEGVMAELRAGLGLPGDQTLAVSTLRGQHADNRAWLQDPTAPAIIIGTVDMTGSRLLFSGYGVSRGMRPYHAGLLGADALFVLDEAHLVPPFQALLEAVAHDEAKVGAPSPVPAFRLLTLTATGRTKVGAFRLTPEEAAEPRVKRLLEARKRLAVETLAEGKLASALADRALRRGQGNNRVLVYCDSRVTAQNIADELKKRLGKQSRRGGADRAPAVELLVGARRVQEREALARSAVYRRFANEDGVGEEGPAFLVATAAGEVGVDLDADHMVCDLVAFERMVQRLGRVNRRGRDAPATIDVLVDAKAIEEPVPPKEGKQDSEKVAEQRAKVRRLLAVLKRLPACAEGCYDASPAALSALREDVANAELIAAATSPEPLRPPLARAILEAWSMTSLAEHTGRPEVAPWLRGWVEEEPQTTVIWRAYLPWPYDAAKDIDEQPEPNAKDVETFVEQAPPHLSEQLETETFRVVEILIARAGDERLDPRRPALLVLDRRLGFRRAVRVGELAKLGDKAAARERSVLQSSLTDAIVVVSRDLGGLDGDGLLSEGAAAPPATLDSGFEDVLASVGYRVVLRKAGDASGDPQWKERWRFRLATGEEDEAGDAYVIEELKDKTAAGIENEALGPRRQLLPVHHALAACEAAKVADALGLAPQQRSMLVAAARIHDAGKQRPIWQRYAGNGNGAEPLAKFDRRGNPALLKIGEHTYRHEFGSLAEAECDAALMALPEEERDLALHLIASHHGHARPTIAPVDEQTPPSLLEARARDAALRFARLQRRWGPWGLAWWEAVFRGIDWRASRLDEEGA